MQHLNHSKLCAVSIRTTGNVPNHHELVEITVLAADWNLEPDPKILPLNMVIQPCRPENYDKSFNNVERSDSNICHRIYQVSSEKMSYYVRTGLEYGKAIDLLVEWFERLNMRSGKKLMPISYDWPLVSHFIQDWIGYKTFAEIFDPRSRDLKDISLYLNDRVGYQGRHQYRFPKNNFIYICNAMEAKPDESNSTLSDAVSMLKAYRNLCKVIV